MCELGVVSCGCVNWGVSCGCVNWVWCLVDV